jgi:hypothetical protein
MYFNANLYLFGKLYGVVKLIGLNECCPSHALDGFYKRILSKRQMNRIMNNTSTILKSV